VQETPASEIAEYYERYWTAARGLINIAPANGPVVERLRQLVTPRSSVLDFGCGDGVTIGTWLAANTARYVGFDISRAAVSQARALGLDARVTPTDDRLPFPDGSFDLATCLEVLEHLFEPQIALAELRRVLRPGGAIFITVPNLAYWRRRLDMVVLGRWNPVGDSLSVEQPWRDPHIRFFTRRALMRLLHAAGFEQVDVRGQGGSLLAELPGARRLSRSGTASRSYRALERSFPGLFGGHLSAVARAPG
jgi:methionine biosynthesis protein MetW